LPGPQRRIDLDVEARVAALASRRRASRGTDAVGFGLTPDAKFNLAGFVAAGAARRERSRPRGTLERHMELREGERAIKFHAR
jgi:hypothetical protein